MDSLITSDDIINQLFPNIPVLITHVIVTIVLILVIWRLLYKPFRKALHDRHLAIKKKLDDAASKQALANRDRSEANKRLILASAQYDEIISAAKNKAYDERKEIIDIAKKEAERITNQTKKDILKQRKIAQKEIKKEIEVISLELAKKILDQEINENKHQKLIDDFIDSI